MSKWDKISLFKFQQIDAINAKSIDEIDKTLFSICVVFNLTEYELDNAGLKKADKLATKLTRIFNAPFEPVISNRIGKYRINYDISKMTFGQYIELAFFLSANPLQNGQYIMASISNVPFLKNNSKYHRKKADYFLTQPITKIMGSIKAITENFTRFNNEYKDLFGLGEQVSEEVKEDKFNKRYGWIYSASQIAEYERITLDEAFKLPVRQAFNDLAYLKAKAAYEHELLNRK